MPALIEHIHGNKEGIDKIIQSFVDSYRAAEIPKTQVKRMITECANKLRGEIPLVKSTLPGDAAAPVASSGDGVPAAVVETPVASGEAEEGEAVSVVPRSPAGPSATAEGTIVADPGASESVPVGSPSPAAPSAAAPPAPTCIYFGTSRWIVKPEYLEKYCSKLKVSGRGKCGVDD